MIRAYKRELKKKQIGRDWGLSYPAVCNITYGISGGGIADTLQNRKDAGKKVFLILDNLQGYHSKPVKAWLEENKEKIEVFYLPSYSPNSIRTNG